MLKQEKTKSATYEKIHQRMEIIFNECKLKPTTLADLKAIFFTKYGISISKPSLYTYVGSMQDAGMTFEITRKCINGGNVYFYRTTSEKFSTDRLPKVIRKTYVTVEDDAPTFNPPRNAFINKLFGLVA